MNDSRKIVINFQQMKDVCFPIRNEETLLQKIASSLHFLEKVVYEIHGMNISGLSTSVTPKIVKSILLSEEVIAQGG